MDFQGNCIFYLDLKETIRIRKGKKERNGQTDISSEYHADQAYIRLYLYIQLFLRLSSYQRIVRRCIYRVFIGTYAVHSVFSLDSTNFVYELCVN